MNRHVWFLGGLVVVAAVLRLTGLDWGLPWALHIDERLFVAAKAIRLEQSLQQGGGPDPGISSYGILPLWLLVAARALFLDPATTAGAPIHGDSFAATILLSRWISAIWSTATVLLVGLWARRWGPLTALGAAACVAGFPALVQSAHFGTVEAPLVALIVAGLLAAERLAEKPGATRLVIAGAVLGLAASVKAPAAVLLLPLLHAVRDASPRRFVLRALAMVGVAAVVMLALNPGLVAGGETHGGEHTTLTGNLMRAYSSDFRDWTLPYAHDVPGWTELTRLLPFGMGVIPEVLALLGLIVFLRRREPRDVRLLLVLVPLLLLVLTARVKTIRFLLPALPLLAVLGADAVRTLVPRRRVAVGLMAAVGAITLLHGAAYLSIWTRPDARVAAAHWLDANVGEREIVVVEDPPGYGPPIGSPSPALVRPRLRYEILWRGFYLVHERSTAEERQAHLDRTLKRADWLVLSEGHRREFTTAPELRPVESAFYAQLDAGELPFEKVEEFATFPRLGPWRLDDRRAEVLFRVFDHPIIEVWKRRDDAS